MPYIRKLTTIADVRAARPTMIFYGTNTCWWTHKASDLCSKPSNQFSLPCDPRGGMLYQTDDIEGFLKNAEEQPEHYGSHGLDAFIASHNDNCVVSEFDLRSTCLRTFQEYNDLMDSQGL